MKPIYLQAGCGPILFPSTEKEEWVNLDIQPIFEPDVCMDILEVGEKFGDDYFSGAYSCHHLEHLPFGEGVQKFFHVMKKIIKPGGILRLVVPDLKKVARKYVDGESLQDIFDGPYFTYKDLPATRFLFWCRAFEHTVLFDEELLRNLAEDAGFTNCQAVPLNRSTIQAFAGRDRFLSESLAFEATA